jgi:methyl-accepting chemotaxis protein-1 (serine sensor receptor)
MSAKVVSVNFRQYSIRIQISVLLVSALLLIAVMGGVGWFSLHRAGELVLFGQNVSTPRQKVANELIDSISARAIGARNLVLMPSAEAREAQRVKIVAAHEKTQAALQRLRALTSEQVQPRETELLKAVYDAEALYGPVALAITELGVQGKTDEAIQRIVNECEPLLARLTLALHAVVEYENAAAEGDVNRMIETDRNAQWLMAGLGAVSLLLMVVLGVVVARGLIQSTGRTVLAVQQMAAGDLTVNVPVSGNSETDQVLKAVNQMAARLREVLGQVRQAAHEIGTASAEVATGAGDLSMRTEQTASNLEQTAASMEELTSTVRQSSDSARQANQLAGNAAEVAQHGGAVVGKVVDTMAEINQSSQKIHDIIGVIDGIAFQTNILALNAAVEAARAGEQGRGFAVVAGEVRSLAQRSDEAAKEIKQLISDSVAKVESGTLLVREAGTTISDVVDNARRVNDIVSEMMAASHEQAEGIGQVNTAVSQLDQMTQQNAALVEQSAAAAESLQDQARRLVEAVGVFNIGGGGHMALPAPGAVRRLAAR